MFRYLKKHLSGGQLIATGFLFIIFIGTLLLMLPISSRDGQSTDLLTALFTTTSATCVTGLVVVDTYAHWSTFGQLIILCLIQIGGLGFISIGVAFSIFLRRKIGLLDRGLISESFNIEELNGVVRLTKKVIYGTFFFEGCGAIILAACFIPRMGALRGLYYGVFHSISAFCNGGFDLMGYYNDSSMVYYNSNPVVMLTLIALIVIGGIGFVVWNDLSVHRLHWKRYRLHTKIVLIATTVLVLGGALFFYIFEHNNVFADMTLSQKILNSLFCSVTPRTAGFNSVDNAALSDGGKLLSIILMFIGGAPGSTAGGIKVTTIVVLLVSVRSTLLRTDGSNILGKRLSEAAIAKASTVFFLNMLLAVGASLFLCNFETAPIIDIMFECFSALSTVGMSAGLTGQLNTISRVVIILLMYVGRVGSLTFAMSFTDKKKIAHVKLPMEKINIG